MKSYVYVKLNVVVYLLDIETCSSIGEVDFQLSPVFLASTSLAKHTLVDCDDIVCLATLMNIIRKSNPLNPEPFVTRASI